MPLHRSDCVLSVSRYVARCVHAAGKLKDFKAYLEGEGAERQDIKTLREEVEALANSFPMPGL
jgi:hypothetical protein